MPIQEPERWWRTWVEYFEKGDMDGIMSIYAPGAVVVATPGNPTQGDAAREAIQSFASLNGKLKWAGETIVRGPAWATIYVQDWTFNAGRPDNPLHLAGTATVQLAERAGGWVGLIDDFNSQG
jgi:ketosteroid isomerase-like protein